MPSATSTIADLLTESTEKVADLSGFSISSDIVLIFVAFVVLTAILLALRRSGAIALIVGAYVAIPLYAYFPYLSEIQIGTDTAANAFYSHALIFIGLTILGYFIARRFVSLEGSIGTASGIAEAAVLATGFLGLLIAIGYHLIPVDALYDFAPSTDRLFESVNLFFWWLLAPLVAILFTTRRFI